MNIFSISGESDCKLSLQVMMLEWFCLQRQSGYADLVIRDAQLGPRLGNFERCPDLSLPSEKTPTPPIFDNPHHCN